MGIAKTELNLAFTNYIHQKKVDHNKAEKRFLQEIEKIINDADKRYESVADLASSARSGSHRWYQEREDYLKNILSGLLERLNTCEEMFAKLLADKEKENQTLRELLDFEKNQRNELYKSILRFEGDLIKAETAGSD